jgi:NAD(P)-dependent dehydrogenase (short-subunit alcohol dehydrogenase family)
VRELVGRVAVVTGSASGLGRAMAERFGSEGMTVVIADNRLGDAEIVAGEIAAQGGRAVAMPVDVTKRDSVVALADRVDAELGGASLLVNNAGVAAPSTYLEADEQEWRWVMDVNVFGVLYGMQTFVPRMLARGGEGHVVSTSSFGGLIGPNCFEGNRFPLADGEASRGRGMQSYMVSKHAVVALSEGLAGDLKGTPIGVSVLCPAHHDNTGIYENSARFRPAEYGGPNEEAAQLAEDVAKRRPEKGKDPSELAGRVVRAVRERHFYIFTHPENRFIVEQRFHQMLAGFDDAASFVG